MLKVLEFLEEEYIWEIHLFFPRIYINRNTSILGEMANYWEIDFCSRFFFMREEFDCTTFELRILGFGFGAVKQLNWNI